MRSWVMSWIAIGALASGCGDGLAVIADALVADNGRSLNGRSLNGRSLNGRSLNGPTLAGELPGGIQIVGVWVEGSALHAATDNGAELEGDELVGARLEGTLRDGTAVTLVVSEVRAREPDVLAHSISFVAGDEEPGWVCGLAGDGRPIGAVPLAGAWDYGEGTPTGGSRVDDPDAITFACEDGALGKCVELGYRPWSSVEERLGRRTHLVALAELHQACTRALRADYCGDGMSHTLADVEIDLWDGVGVQGREPSRPGRWAFEAEWTIGGASCVRRERIADTGAREYVEERCPERWTDEPADPCGTRRSDMYAPVGFDADLGTRTLLMNEVPR
ncbi:MAG: hypothetical protein HYY06_22855 [Deltaproteobacteria bacterium]|nr:hypothetical protein [Deltaproteobacteria bacterium]